MGFTVFKSWTVLWGFVIETSSAKLGSIFVKSGWEAGFKNSSVISDLEELTSFADTEHPAEELPSLTVFTPLLDSFCFWESGDFSGIGADCRADAAANIFEGFSDLLPFY